MQRDLVDLWRDDVQGRTDRPASSAGVVRLEHNLFDYQPLTSRRQSSALVELSLTFPSLSSLSIAAEKVQNNNDVPFPSSKARKSEEINAGVRVETWTSTRGVKLRVSPKPPSSPLPSLSQIATCLRHIPRPFPPVGPVTHSSSTFDATGSGCCSGAPKNTYLSLIFIYTHQKDVSLPSLLSDT